MFLTSQDQVRQVEWSRNYLWDVQISDAPSPFNTWFPATDVAVDMGILESESFDIFVSSFSIPVRTKERTLSLTFVDDANHTLVDWLTLWYNQIVVPGGIGGGWVQTLEESVKNIQIARLNSRRVPIKVGSIDYIESYAIYPNDTVRFLGGSEESKVNSYEAKFIIAGVIDQPWIENMISKGKINRV